MTYWHGGFGGLRVGDLVRPPALTGAPTLADYGAAAVCRRDRVYVTTEKEAAAIYAAMHPSGRGKVYEVEPLGELVADPDCDEAGLSYEVEEARVVRVFTLARADREQIVRAMLYDPRWP
jgi:hypothetical protein